MTNDTSTLNGSLVEMKDQLIYELGEKGVTATYDPVTGLEGLIHKISEIPTLPSNYIYNLDESVTISSKNDSSVNSWTPGELFEDNIRVRGKIKVISRNGTNFAFNLALANQVLINTPDNISSYSGVNLTHTYNMTGFTKQVNGSWGEINRNSVTNVSNNNVYYLEEWIMGTTVIGVVINMTSNTVEYANKQTYSHTISPKTLSVQCWSGSNTGSIELQEYSIERL